MVHKPAAATKFTDLMLPVEITTSAEVRRINRELSRLEEFCESTRLRTGAELAELPKLSRLLTILCSRNQLDLLKPADRKQAIAYIDDVAAYAPVLHISFASEPSQAFMAKITGWFRENISSSVLLEVGLEPGIAAGCIVRTENRQFDFSLRKFLDGKRDLLAVSMTGAR